MHPRPVQPFQQRRQLGRRQTHHRPSPAAIGRPRSPTGWWISIVAGAIAAAFVGASWAAAALFRRVAFRECARGYAYSVLISLQLACTLLAESRGPFLGLLAGLFTLALLVAAVSRKRLLMMALMGLAATALGVLVLANIPGSPLHALQDVPTVGRLTKVLTTEGPARVRLLIWGGSAELFTKDSERAIVGYGPETFRLAMAPHYRAELGPLTDRASWPDRAHNQTFDLLIETGVIGAGAYYALVLSLVHLALRQLGVLATTREGWSFIALSVAGAAAAAGGARLVDASWRFLGLCPTFGILIGVTAFLVRAGLRTQPREQDTHIRASQWWPRCLIMCLTETASMLGHVQARRTRWTAAAHALARALEIEPERSEDRLALAGVYEHLGRTAEARRMYESILERDADHATARAGLEALQSP